MADYAIDGNSVASRKGPLKSYKALEAGMTEGKAVYRSSGSVGIADKTTQEKAKVVGITVTKATNVGDEIVIAEIGAEVELGTVAGLAVGDPLFASTNGNTSPLTDVTTGQWPTLVAWCIAATPAIIRVDPSLADIQKA